MTVSVNYDDALPRFAACLAKEVGPDAVLNHFFLRDATGKLTLILRDDIDGKVIQKLTECARDLNPWVDQDFPITNKDNIFDISESDFDNAIPERIDSECFSGFVKVIERRIVGNDWLQGPRAPIADVPPIVVFASHKGGVGRSTALAVAASAFSEAGKNILVIDLDLEAPGLGDIFLRDLPKWGALDFYVEDGIRDLDRNFYSDLLETSPLASKGLIHVVPAVGKVGRENPANILAKISRAYIERVSSSGVIETFSDRTRRLVKELTQLNDYDAIFVDARAGLNESTAAAVLGLGGDVLLFGVNTQQTFSGYSYFLSHLAKFRPSSSGDEDWRLRLRMVHAKAESNPDSHAKYRTEAFDLFSEFIYDTEDGIDEDSLNFNYDEVSAPHFAWPIANDSNYVEFSPLLHKDQFARHMYDRTFGTFISSLADQLGVTL